MLPIETPRCRLRLLKLSDAAFYLKLVNDPSFIQNIRDKGLRTIAAAEHDIENLPLATYAKYGYSMYLVEKKSTGEAIGMCGIVRRDTLEGPDIGYAFLPEFTGQGYAFEAAHATVEYAKVELGLPKLLGITLPSNQSSNRLLQKLGFQKEKEVVLNGGDELLNLYILDF